MFNPVFNIIDEFRSYGEEILLQNNFTFMQLQETKDYINDEHKNDILNYYVENEMELCDLHVEKEMLEKLLESIEKAQTTLIFFN